MSYFTHLSLWQVSNLESQLCVDVDKAMDSCRTALNKCSVSTDLAAFVDQFATGGVKPVPIRYEAHRMDQRQLQPQPQQSPQVWESQDVSWVVFCGLWRRLSVSRHSLTCVKGSGSDRSKTLPL